MNMNLNKMKKMGMFLIMIVGFDFNLASLLIASDTDSQGHQSMDYVEVFDVHAQGFTLIGRDDFQEFMTHEMAGKNCIRSAVCIALTDALSAAENVIAFGVEHRFCSLLYDAILQDINIYTIEDPIFRYVMKYRDVFLYSYIKQWVNDYRLFNQHGIDEGTLLNTSIYLKRYSITKFLINSGADVNCKSGYCNHSPLYQASINKSGNFAKLLLKHGAQAYNQDEWRKTSLFNAVNEDNKNMVKLLIPHLVHYNMDILDLLNFAAEKGADKIVRMMYQNFLTEEDLNNKKNESLFIAVQFNQYFTVRLLLQLGMDPNFEDELGETALFSLQSDYENSSDGQGYIDSVPEILDILLDYGADINHQNHQGQTALLQAVLDNEDRIVTLLLDRGANLGIADNDGDTAIDYA